MSVTPSSQPRVHSTGCMKSLSDGWFNSLVFHHTMGSWLLAGKGASPWQPAQPGETATTPGELEAGSHSCRRGLYLRLPEASRGRREGALPPQTFQGAVPAHSGVKSAAARRLKATGHTLRPLIPESSGKEVGAPAVTDDLYSGKGGVGAAKGYSGTRGGTECWGRTDQGLTCPFVRGSPPGHCLLFLPLQHPVGHGCETTG